MIRFCLIGKGNRVARQPRVVAVLTPLISNYLPVHRILCLEVSDRVNKVN